MKKTLLLSALALASLALFSCGSGSVHGTYVFQLGRDKGVHARAEMQLLGDKVYADESQTKLLGESFRFTIDIQMSASTSSAQGYALHPWFVDAEGTSEPSGQASSEPSSEDSSESSDPVSTSIGPTTDIRVILQFLYGIFGDGSAVVGYYHVGSPAFTGGSRLHLGIRMNENIKSALATLTGLDPDSFDITPELTEVLLYSTIEGKALNLTFPVSVNDFMIQLFWYGYDVYVDDDGAHIEQMAVGHEPGTHPTADEVARINQEGIFNSHHPDLAFRDYYVVSLDLTKR